MCALYSLSSRADQSSLVSLDDLRRVLISRRLIVISVSCRSKACTVNACACTPLTSVSHRDLSAVIVHVTKLSEAFLTYFLSRSTVQAWDLLSDSRVSFDEGLTRDRCTHTATLERMFRDLNSLGQLVHGCRRELTVPPCRKVTSVTLVKLGLEKSNDRPTSSARPQGVAVVSQHVRGTGIDTRRLQDGSCMLSDSNGQYETHIKTKVHAHVFHFVQFSNKMYSQSAVSLILLMTDFSNTLQARCDSMKYVPLNHSKPEHERGRKAFICWHHTFGGVVFHVVVRCDSKILLVRVLNHLAFSTLAFSHPY
ncbi:hypothetical protein J6590_033554 [Homalodisca vitripennis]|nr:hypothetical protein J6590_033554 [Homalodisca vitripennis]